MPFAPPRRTISPKCEGAPSWTAQEPNGNGSLAESLLAEQERREHAERRRAALQKELDAARQDITGLRQAEGTYCLSCFEADNNRILETGSIGEHTAGH